MRSRTAHGYTLLELMIAMGMTAMIVAAAMSLLIGQQRAYQAGTTERGLQEAGQTALLAVGERLRSAGYGVDPAYALDFGDVDRVPQQGLRANQKLTYFKAYACTDPVVCRDQSHGGAATGSDEVVLYSRNPMFSRPVTAATQAVVTIVGTLKKPIHQGQVLQVMCLGGDKLRAYVTAGGEVAAAATYNPTTAVSIPLAPGVLTNGLSTFPFQNDQLQDPCFSTGPTVLAQIDRYRYFVSWFDENGLEVAPHTNWARPFLMLDQGLIGDDGNAIVTPVAENVEDLQFSYVFSRAGAGLPVRISGEQVGTSIASDGNVAISTAIQPPAIDEPADAVSRASGSPPNIMAIRMSVVVRTPEMDGRLVTAEDRAIPSIGNRAAFTGVAGFRRSVFQDTFLLPNLGTNALVYCAIGSGPGYNLGGC